MTFKEKHKKDLKILLIVYIIFAGCFSFPIYSEQFKLSFMRLYLFVAQYGIIGTAFAGLYGMKKGKFVYTLTGLLTIIGLICRYLLEFGEVSNTYNFTLFNIIVYLGIFPLGTTLIYQIAAKSMEHKE